MTRMMEWDGFAGHLTDWTIEEDEEDEDKEARNRPPKTHVVILWDHMLLSRAFGLALRGLGQSKTPAYFGFGSWIALQTVGHTAPEGEVNHI